MLMQEFIDTYCADLKALYVSTESIIDDGIDLPYDDVIEDDSGHKVKIVWCGDTAIPIYDIVASERSDFIKTYPSFECRELYDSYMDALYVLDGEDAVKQIRNEILREQQRIGSLTIAEELSDLI